MNTCEHSHDVALAMGVSGTLNQSATKPRYLPCNFTNWYDNPNESLTRISSTTFSGIRLALILTYLYDLTLLFA